MSPVTVHVAFHLAPLFAGLHFDAAAITASAAAALLGHAAHLGVTLPDKHFSFLFNCFLQILP